MEKIIKLNKKHVFKIYKISVMEKLMVLLKKNQREGCGIQKSDKVFEFLCGICH